MSEWTMAKWQAFLDSGGGNKPPSYVPPSLHGSTKPKQWASDNQDFIGMGMDVAMLIALIKVKGAAIRMAGRYLWVIPATAYSSALATILAVELLVGKKEANQLSQWYADAVTDPLAWHVETDRVVQGASKKIISEFTEGVITSPGVAGDIASSAYQWGWLDRIDDWRAVGSML